MGVLLALILIITVPLFYITGLIVCIRWLAHGGRTAGEYSRRRLAEAIQAHSMTETGETRRQLQVIAANFARGVPLATTYPQAPAPADTAPPPSQPAASPAPPNKDWTQVDVAGAFKNLDNINLLLYLGAFLIVVSAGIFVGYNFVTLSGVFKTGFLALFAVVFYAVGLYLFLCLPKLRPAGSTFTGIGLVLLPLVGAAAYNFTGAHNHGPLLWFVTSLVTLACYVVTLALTRQTYIAYLMAFTTLSLFESSISLVTPGIYWYGWGLSVASLLLITVSPWSGWWKDARSSLDITAGIFVPISLLFSIWQTGTFGLTQLGVTFGLAGIFYGVLAVRRVHLKSGLLYWTSALCALPLALGMGLWDNVAHPEIAVVLVALSVGYLWLGLTRARDIGSAWRGALGAVSGLLPFAAASIELAHPAGLLACLATAVAINVIFARRLKSSALALLVIIASLALPYVFLRQYLSPAASAGNMATAYLALGCVLIYYRQQLKGWPESGDVVGMAGYLLAFGIALVTASASGHLSLLLVSLAIGALLYALSFLENLRRLVFGATAVLALGLIQLVPLWSWPLSAYATAFLIMGALLYGAGLYVSSSKRAAELRMSGVILPLVGALVGAVAASSVTSAFALATGGALMMAEAVKRHKLNVAEGSGAVIVLAYDWYLILQNVTNAQLLAVPWAAYLAILAYRRRGQGHQAYDALTALALAALTIPIAGQALSSNGQWYGLELIGVALALIALGFSLRYKLVTYWGAGTLVAEVLYQLRSVIFALPKYLISAVLGLALLAVAIILLQRRKPN